jgi:hypothetical protein
VTAGGRPTEKDPSSGAELIERLQRTLGIAILVQSVEPAEPEERGASVEPNTLHQSGDTVTIRATFLFASNTTDVAVTGDTETEAWDALARAAIVWRNSDFQHVPWWGGGG